MGLPSPPSGPHWRRAEWTDLGRKTLTLAIRAMTWCCCDSAIVIPTTQLGIVNTWIPLAVDTVGCASALGPCCASSWTSFELASAPSRPAVGS